LVSQEQQENLVAPVFVQASSSDVRLYYGVSICATNGGCYCRSTGSQLKGTVKQLSWSNTTLSSGQPDKHCICCRVFHSCHTVAKPGPHLNNTRYALSKPLVWKAARRDEGKPVFITTWLRHDTAAKHVLHGTAQHQHGTLQHQQTSYSKLAIRAPYLTHAPLHLG
jgi:hypothetical protein